MIFIYALLDPDTQEVRYIGKSVRPRERLANHCNERSVTWRTNWIREVIARGKRPDQRILETLGDDADWKAAERRWIAYGRSQGWRLTNCTSGGDGVPDLPPEIRRRVASAWIGRKHTPESIEKMSAERRTRRASAEHREHIRQKMIGREFTPQWRERISRAVSKLTDAQVVEVRRLLALHVSQYVIAKQFGVHQGTISNIKRGLSYGHVPIDSLAAS